MRGLLLMSVFGFSHYRASLHCIALDTVLVCYPLIWDDLRITRVSASCSSLFLSNVGAYACNLVRVLDGVLGLIRRIDECTRLIQQISHDIFIRNKQTLYCTCFSASPSI